MWNFGWLVKQIGGIWFFWDFVDFETSFMILAIFSSSSAAWIIFHHRVQRELFFIIECSANIGGFFEKNFNAASDWDCHNAANQTKSVHTDGDGN